MACGIVLVGGLSSRMGSDKALLPVGGVPMALLQACKLDTFCSRTALVGKERGGFEGCGYPFVRDGTDERAALHGLLAALEWSPEETVVVLAADVPRLSAGLLSALLARALETGAPALVPSAGGHPQPLAAVWTKRALPALRAAAAAGDLSLRRAMESARAVVLSEEETAALPGFVPGAFSNVNTPEDYRAVQEETA